MKRFGLLVVTIGLLLGYTPTSQAQEESVVDYSVQDLCKKEAPPSCFSAVTTENGNAETKKRENTPKHCPQDKWTLTGLNTSVSPTLIVICNVFGIDNCDTEIGVKQIQNHLSTACGESTCKPETSIDPVNELTITCSESYFSDGKYGLCTEEAVRRYLEWNKVNHCDTKPSLSIIAPKTAIQGEVTKVKIHADGGEVYIWDDETAFISKPMDPVTLENLKITSSNANVHTEISEALSLDSDISLTFSSTGKTDLVATGNVTDKPNLASTSDPAPITVISADKEESNKSSTELGCNQLLPKYLVGASCDTELKGDARDITYWLQKFSGQITTFIAAIAVLLIAWNAFGLVLSAGDSDGISTKKKALMWVGIGLLLTVFAYVIIKTALSLTFLQ